MTAVVEHMPDLIIWLPTMELSGSPGSIVAPRLTQHPPWERFLTGDRIVLKCDAGKKLRSINYIWNINGRGDLTGDEIYIIEAAALHDNGVYKCKIKSTTPALQTVYSNTVQLSITKPDSSLNIEAVPEMLWVGQRLLLRCNFFYALSVKFIYTFYLEGSNLTEIRSRNKSVTTQIESVTREDGGRYRCQAGFAQYPNAPVYSSAHKLVSILESPVRLSVEPEAPTDGDTVTLRCVCTDPQACRDGQYSFLKNGALVNSDSATPDVYRIERTTVRDSGMYHCAVLSNSFKHTAQSVQITVRSGIVIPRLTKHPPWERYLTGDRIILKCDVGKTPGSKNYFWNINGQDDITGSESYIIEAAALNYTGVYKCKINTTTSTLHTAYSNIIRLSITEPDLLVTIEAAPEIIWVGQRLFLRCNFSYALSHEFIYTFYLEGSNLTEIRTMDKSVTTHIESVTLEEGGRYRCQAGFLLYPDGPIFSSTHKLVNIKVYVSSDLLSQRNPFGMGSSTFPSNEARHSQRLTVANAQPW
ncbi:Fc receptor-like protein 5 [Cetorhinus maximus]